MPFLRALSTTIVLATGGCSFDADYSGTGITCTDGRCPAGTVCRADATCGPPIDAPSDDAIDARMPALTCADPGVLPATGGSAMGTTTGRSATVSAMCGGFVMNGKDAIYELELPAARTIHVDIAGGRKAYAIAPCTVAPATPACLGNAFAAGGVPLTITPAAGATFIVVDDENPANASGYTLTVTVD